MKKNRSPYLILILSFLITIIIGTIILLLPFSTKKDVNITLVDAFFTATSAVCVTGLSPFVDLGATFTIFGKIVIALLIEIGGLGFITIVIFIFSVFGMKIGMNDRYLIKESLNQNSLKGMVKLVRFTVFITLSVQLIGAIINLIVFLPDYPLPQALGYSIFHAISSFNNAGFDFFGSDSLYSYRSSVLLNINTMVLVFLGGIGFIVIDDLLHNHKWQKLSIHSRIVLKTSFFLIIGGALVFKILENDKISWLQAFFNSVSIRTAGFTTANFTLFSSASLIIIMILMLIGASPASAGGGIKTTTVYTIYKYIISFGKNKQPLAYKRQIAANSVAKAFVLVVFSLVFIIIIIFLLSVIEANNPLALANQYHFYHQISFEVVSAFATAGNSMGLTTLLHPLSKLLLCLTMFFGRLGPITLITAFNRQTENIGIKYIEERIIIG